VTPADLVRLRADLASARHKTLLLTITSGKIARELDVMHRNVSDLEHMLTGCGIERETHMKVRLVPKLCPVRCRSGWVHSWTGCDDKMDGFTIFGLGVFWR
jgi:hypothetical protein